MVNFFDDDGDVGGLEDGAAELLEAGWVFLERLVKNLRNLFVIGLNGLCEGAGFDASLVVCRCVFPFIVV